MAYSDYGGFAYRNGELIIERSDAVFTTEGLKSTPGLWPGFFIEEGRAGGSYHAILGDGPVHLTLYKQSSVGLYLNGERIDLSQFAHQEAIKFYEQEGQRHYYIEEGFYRGFTPLRFMLDGHEITIWWTFEDNFYVYARLVQPDGVVWTGWSGYGVGCGFNGQYGYHNGPRNMKLAKLLEEE